MKTRLIFILCVALGIASCGVKSSFYQKQVPVPGAKWSSKFQPHFKIEIKDVKARYNVSLLMRHDEAYPNANLWFRMKIKAPGDSVFRDGARIEKQLTNAAGEWLGRGMGTIWEERIAIPVREAPQFTKPGMYEIKIEQLMRNDPLPSVLNVGLRIEKLKN
ncbi:MAG: gliding motility lipoprotein GldH [Taibaiella sp.]